MRVTDHALFPTRLLAIDFPDVDALNRDLFSLLTGEEFRGGFNMHPDALNLLSLAPSAPAIARLRDMFLDGLRHWLLAERVRGPQAAEMVLFSNLSSHGEYTLVHNHNADVVGVYYAQTADPDGPTGVVIPGPDDEYDYFAPGDGVLMLHDPRFNANLAAVGVADHVKVYPRPGLMLLFPGYLWHSVTPHAGGRQRLAFSANFRLRWEEGAKPEVVPLTSGAAPGRVSPHERA